MNNAPARYVIEDLDEIERSALWADSKLGFDLAVCHHDRAGAAGDPNNLLGNYA